MIRTSLKSVFLLDRRNIRVEGSNRVSAASIVELQNLTLIFGSEPGARFASELRAGITKNE